MTMTTRSPGAPIVPAVVPDVKTIWIRILATGEEKPIDAREGFDLIARGHACQVKARPFSVDTADLLRRVERLEEQYLELPVAANRRE